MSNNYRKIIVTTFIAYVTAQPLQPEFDLDFLDLVTTDLPYFAFTTDSIDFGALTSGYGLSTFNYRDTTFEDISTFPIIFPTSLPTFIGETTNMELTTIFPIQTTQNPISEVTSDSTSDFTSDVPSMFTSDSVSDVTSNVTSKFTSDSVSNFTSNVISKFTSDLTSDSRQGSNSISTTTKSAINLPLTRNTIENIGESSTANTSTQINPNSIKMTTSHSAWQNTTEGTPFDASTFAQINDVNETNDVLDGTKYMVNGTNDVIERTNNDVIGILKSKLVNNNDVIDISNNDVIDISNNDVMNISSDDVIDGSVESTTSDLDLRFDLDLRLKMLTTAAPWGEETTPQIGWDQFTNFFQTTDSTATIDDKIPSTLRDPNSKIITSLYGHKTLTTKTPPPTENVVNLSIITQPTPPSGPPNTPSSGPENTPSSVLENTPSSGPENTPPSVTLNTPPSGTPTIPPSGRPNLPPLPDVNMTVGPTANTTLEFGREWNVTIEDLSDWTTSNASTISINSTISTSSIPVLNLEEMSSSQIRTFLRPSFLLFIIFSTLLN
jgi:hypothetical protein